MSVPPCLCNWCNATLTCHQIAASNSWNEIPGQGNSPGPRVGHTTVLHDNKLYLFGGKNHLDQYLDDLWQFSFETISWTNIGGNRAQSYEEWFTIKDPTSALYRNVVAARPAGRFGHSAVIGSSFGTAGENVAVMTIFGGYSPNCTDFCNDMWHYVFASNSWIMLYGEWNGAGGEREAMYDYGKLNQTVPVRRWRHSGLKITDPGKDYLLIFGGNLPGNPAACCGYMCKETCPIKCSDAGFSVGQKFQSWNPQMFDSSNCTFANDLWKVNLQTFEAFESNLAVEKQVLMSSTEGFHLARLAIDGNPSTYAATLLESQPFWQCTLGAINFISSMVITNVPGKDRERLSNFYVFLSLEPFSSQRLQDLLLDPQVWKIQFMYAVSDTLTIQPMQTAGFVRIQLAGTNSLILPEVKINGYPPIQSWQNLQGIRKWTSIKPLDPSKAPGPRYGQASVYVEKFETVVVYGGFVAEHPYYLDDWWSFNTRTNAWFQILPKARQPMNVLPSGRSGHAIFYFHELRNTDTNELCEECPDLIFLNGGEQGSNRILDRNSQVSFSSSFVWDLWQYNMQTRVLSQMAFTAGPKPRSMHSATVYKNSVYIYGGRTDKPDASVASSSESCPNGICGDFWTYELGGSNPCPGRCGITKGKCLSGFCECLPRFSGADCGSLRCPGSQCVYDKENNRLVDCNDCSGNGICNDGKCQCNDGFKGETCGKVACPNDCSQHGTCKLRSGEGAVCDCDTGFATLDCSVGMLLFVSQITNSFTENAFRSHLSR